VRHGSAPVWVAQGESMSHVVSAQTQGDFLLSLAQLRGEYTGKHQVRRELIVDRAIKLGIEIDASSPQAELDIVLTPLEKFLNSVVMKKDESWICAEAHLVWEAHKRYLEQHDMRKGINSRHHRS
jgi:hypothetical protein